MFPMDQRLLILLAALCSPVLILAMHIILSRLALALKSKRQPQFICLRAVLFANVPFAALLWMIFLNANDAGTAPGVITYLPSFIYAFIVFNLIGYTYFHIYNMSETARRVRILYDIYSKGHLTRPDIGNIYNKGDMVAVRIERLLGLGQIKEVGGAYYLDGRLLFYAAVVLAFWSRLIGFSIMPEGLQKKRKR